MLDKPLSLSTRKATTSKPAKRKYDPEARRQYLNRQVIDPETGNMTTNRKLTNNKRNATRRERVAENRDQYKAVADEWLALTKKGSGGRDVIDLSNEQVAAIIKSDAGEVFAAKSSLDADVLGAANRPTTPVTNPSPPQLSITHSEPSEDDIKFWKSLPSLDDDDDDGQAIDLTSSSHDAPSFSSILSNKSRIEQKDGSLNMEAIKEIFSSIMSEPSVAPPRPAGNKSRLGVFSTVQI